ncbi:dynein heavy chain, N-terminal region 1-domain-containing protein [Lactarius deliciosus]|nr:dynein heavy chain, N-terminal region 1-domain-containing protein [Lactarius deliciosus]
MSCPYTPTTSTHVNGTNGTNGTSPIPHDEAAPSSSFDPGIFRTYLLSLLPPVLGATPAEIDSIFDDEFDERVTRFASEGTGVIYIAKRRDEVEDDMPPTFSYLLTTHLVYTPSNSTTLALIKRGPTLDPITPLATQLHILNLFGGEETPYESLHAVVSNGVKPWFDAFVGARGQGKDGDNKMGIPMTKKKFAELELSLLHLQQNVEIPETHLIIHPVIQKAVEQARATGARPNLSYIPPKLLSDSTFLNTLHAHVNAWIKSIQAVTKLNRDEINFWLSLERALEGIENQLRSEEVNMVMDCLRNAKRFHATVSFIADTGLNDATDNVHKYNQLMKDFPLNELLSAPDVDKIQEALTLIFMHTFERLLSQTTAIFRSWDDLIKEFTNRSERPTRIKLQERTRYLREWRRQHEQLAVMTGPTKGLGGVGMEVGGMDMEEEVKEAYEGTEIWVAAENAYNERVARVENQIISRLRDRLGTARNANEMFRVFSKFNALFVRPKIRGAIQEYQTQLIDSVKEDIKRLHDKFKTQYRYSEAYHISKRQLLTYMKRVEDVLGKGWELYAEGQKLQSESAAFRRKLDTRPVYEAWLHDIGRRDMGVTGRLFEIVRLRGGGFQLAVNFDPQIITLFKDVRNLLWLGFQVPHAITNMAKDAKRVYPHAVSLMETVRTYGQTLDLVEHNKGIEWLVAEYRNEAQRMVTRGMGIGWESFASQYYAARYVSSDWTGYTAYSDKTNSVIDLYKDILRAVEDLATCSYTTEAFTELLSRIQAAIDRLNLEGYANLDHWVAELDKKIEGILLQRLKHVTQAWCTEFDRTADDGELRRDPIPSKRRGDKQRGEKFLEGSMTLKPIVHEIRIQNQVIFLDPPIEYARQTWLQQLHDWLGECCPDYTGTAWFAGLRRIQSSRYEIGLPDAGHGSIRDVLTQFADDTLQRPFVLIEAKVQQLKDYVAKWLQFQSLWDLEAEYHWQQLLTEIKRSRITKEFGVCVVDYEQVQARVNAKYDAWQRDILSRFGVKLGNAMKEMHASILKARNDLEHQSIEGLVGGARRF